MTDTSKVKTVQHEEASRLPDTSWLWRRVLIFAVCTVCLLIAWRVSERVDDVGTLRQINRYAYGMLALSLILYGVGATMTDLTRLVTAFLSTKRITESSGSPPATVTEGRVEASGSDELPPDQRVRL